ncbi:hypothetical protein GSI_14214 [Ganoderma sinense ZZ0214-1]|uniref:HNH nuclease domain-containing protein n=1 Tax=Ganoderma sinense ZZ0214-1 TaxID=1077348 RepID=A0A2G8RSG9_9APHY|nr:hypothetical protein GSI_14214 [Ganoderma sinense ZZ0214-1]
MTALPSYDSAAKVLSADNPSALALYNSVVLPAEQVASEAAATDNDATFRAMFARVVGYLLLYPPSDLARAVVQGEIERCADKPDQNDAVYDLGEMYVMDFILPFFSRSYDRTPRPPQPDLQDSFQHIKEDAYQGRAPRPRDSLEALALALVRDDHLCMVTRMMDMDSWEYHLTNKPMTEWASLTEPCHIFPATLGDTRPAGNDGTTQEDYVAARLWPILERFGYGDIHDALRGDKVHRLENVLMVNYIVHVAFRSMFMWLERTEDQPADCYHVAVSNPRWYRSLRLPHEIQFVAHAGLPLPDPTYLHIHAACCRIASLSGANDYLFWILDEGLCLDEAGKADPTLKYLCYRLVHAA